MWWKGFHGTEYGRKTFIWYKYENPEEDIAVEDEDQVKDVKNLEKCNGIFELVKLFIQKCVIRKENPSDDAFHQCGHMCICRRCCEMWDANILKYVVSRTRKSISTYASLLCWVNLIKIFFYLVLSTIDEFKKKLPSGFVFPFNSFWTCLDFH